MGIFDKLFGREKETSDADEVDVFPTENFAVLEGQLEDGRPFVGSVNLAYNRYRLKSRFPWCLKVGIGLDEGNLYENGLPFADESNVANRMEDRLVQMIQGQGTAHYLGHVFNDSFLDIYLYLDDPEAAHQYLQELIAREDHERGFGYEIKNDPEWLEVGQFLR